MKKSVLLLVLIFGQLFYAQNVILNKVIKSHTNTDKFLYKINPENTTSEYLAEVEVQGFSYDDAEVFGMIYKKAKEVGANAFAYQPFESLEGGTTPFDPVHYKLNLYYVSPGNFPKEDNQVYFIASPHRKQTIALNKENMIFQPRTYTKRLLAGGEMLTVSTKKLLGSTIRLSGQDNQPVQHFQFSAFAVNSNQGNAGGINIKSGDIIKLERSYADFLTTIYQVIP